jgi:hypothetical protein
VLSQQDLRGRQQSGTLAGTECQGSVGQCPPRLHLDDSEQVRRHRHNIDLARLGAQPPTENGPAISHKDGARGRLGAQAARMATTSPLVW